MKKKEFERNKKSSLKTNITTALELPKEVVLSLPLITAIGVEELFIENYKSIIEYNDNILKIKTSCGIFRIEGKKLLLKEITSDNILITGRILKYEYDCDT